GGEEEARAGRQVGEAREPLDRQVRSQPGRLDARHATHGRVLQGGEQEDDSDADDVQRLLAELDDEALTEVFAHMLKQEISEILRLPVARLDASRPLQELGLDSLMSVELVVAVEERFGIRLPVMELSDSSSIDKLTRRIIELLRGTQAVSDSDEQQALAKNTLARHGVELSAQDLAQLDGAASTRLIN
ncbi:acyl carrier protein, partial [Pseudomonas sp.]|uniref:acyl carrier protein n=1 Tax=Pseudomonas sp. TaxID=306 RepID=UPI002590AF84